MARYVILPDIALKLAAENRRPAKSVRLVAPTLLRSQVLSALYARVRAGDLTRRDAQRQLDVLRGLKIRLLGDRVLQGKAWEVAELLGWPDTLDAEYVALTTLQADALVTSDRSISSGARKLVTVARHEDLFRDA